MDFLEKLDYLMARDSLNKSTLSKACNIPYTTIDGWYKKGYEGLKLTTLKKLAKFFGTSLDFWANEQSFDSAKLDEALSIFKNLRPEFQDCALEQIKKLSELQDKT